jgi:hypothetical protein
MLTVVPLAVQIVGVEVVNTIGLDELLVAPTVKLPAGA